MKFKNSFESIFESQTKFERKIKNQKLRKVKKIIEKFEFENI